MEIMRLGSPDNGTCRTKGRAMKTQGIREHEGAWRDFWRTKITNWEPVGQIQLTAVLFRIRRFHIKTRCPASLEKDEDMTTLDPTPHGNLGDR